MYQLTPNIIPYIINNKQVSILITHINYTIYSRHTYQFILLYSIADGLKYFIFMLKNNII